MSPEWLRIVWRSPSGRTGCLLILLLGLLASFTSIGWLGQGWSAGSDISWGEASASHWFGTNRLGQDIFDRALVATATAFRVGLLVTLGAIAIGACLGGMAGWRHDSWLDHCVMWLAGVLDSVPVFLLAAALAFAFGGGVAAMYLAMILSFWTTTARLVRAEVMRLRGQDFILAARAIGLPGQQILQRHLLPNTMHLLLVQASLTFVAAIKTEVILSFLGIGLDDGVSLGLMLAEATQDILAGHLGNFLAASSCLFLLLLGLNLAADALQDGMGIKQAPS
ncbi:MAG: ABC transporter permease [Xanthomonadales bacterium]|nr:ABC transporter permease [Xanthomonadales bacterium]